MIWSTANPRYWANLDLKRLSKKTELIIDTRYVVKSFITPEDPEAVEAIIGGRATLPDASSSSRGSII